MKSFIFQFFYKKLFTFQLLETCQTFLFSFCFESSKKLKEFSDVVETKEIPLEEKLWFKSANFALNTKVVSKAFDDIFKKMGKNLDNPDFSFFVEGKKFEGINMETFKLYVACQNDFSRGKKHNRLSIIVENVETEREYKIVEITNLQREDLDLDEKKEQIKKKFLRLGL